MFDVFIGFLLRICRFFAPIRNRMRDHLFSREVFYLLYHFIGALKCKLYFYQNWQILTLKPFDVYFYATNFSPSDFPFISPGTTFRRHYNISTLTGNQMGDILVSRRIIKLQGCKAIDFIYIRTSACIYKETWIWTDFS